MVAYDSGSIAWVMASASTIVLMAPGISLFYAGTVNKKNFLSIIAYSFLIFSISTLTWGLLGFSLAFGQKTLASGFIGDCTYCGLRYISDQAANLYSNTISFPTFFFLEMLYAGVAGVIFTIPFIGRLRTIYLMLISISYQLIIYSPITYWIRTNNGWLKSLGVIDFSGGTMVHLTSGFASIAVLYMIGPGQNQMQHQNSTSSFSTLIGTILIWFSSFGFNGAAALTSGTPASNALINTQLAAAGGILGWTFSQYIFTDRVKVTGWCSGLVCGVVSITPCSGYVSLWSSSVIGAIAAIIAYIFCHFKSEELKELPDTLGTFSGHGISAFWGVVCAGAFATLQSGNTYEGVFYGGQGGWRLFGLQVFCAVICSIYSFVVMLFTHFLLLRLVQPHLPEEEIQEGLDMYSHVQQNDPLDEEDIVNIIKTLNTYTQLNKMMEATRTQIELEQPKIPFDKSKFKKQAKDRRKSAQEPIPSREKLMQKLAAIDRAKENEMYNQYQKTVKLKHNSSQKSLV